MFGMGMSELLVILCVALLVLGPKRLPELASGLGKAIREFRKATRELTDQIDVDDSVRKPLMELKAALRDEPIPFDPKSARPAQQTPAAPPETATATASHAAAIPSEPLATLPFAPAAPLAAEAVPGSPKPAEDCLAPAVPVVPGAAQLAEKA